MKASQSLNSRTRRLTWPLGRLIFLSRWLQAPLYLGLILAQGVYVYHFLTELWHLVHSAPVLDETTIMMTVLGLIDVVMIANLLITVIVGGYETFVSRLNIEGHPDQPDWPNVQLVAATDNRSLPSDFRVSKSSWAFAACASGNTWPMFNFSQPARIAAMTSFARSISSSGVRR